MDSSAASSNSGGAALTSSYQFSSGNPRIEETRGFMHLYKNDVVLTSSTHLPVNRQPLACVLGVPNHMTYADFCSFCGSFVLHMLEMRVVRTDGMEDRYSVLITFDDQKSADNFYLHLNGRHFSSLEVETCNVLFVVDVQYTGSVEHLQSPPTSSSDQPSCPVCLERLDQDTNGILRTICNHSFHSSCISKWTDSSCPVCRYCQQQPEKSICFICQTPENLWMCLICGFVGCGSYKEGHAAMHWKETEHNYSLELETQRVWDHAGDNYVHRLIQSKTDGKLVELNHCTHAEDRCCSCECGSDSRTSEIVLNSRVEAIVNEYNELLATQLESQKLYFESLLQEAEAETEREKVEAIGKALKQNPKLLKLQTKLEKYANEKKFLDDINDNLVRNKTIWEARIVELEERERRALKLKDGMIQEMEEQLMNLMLSIESETTTAAESPTTLANDMKDTLQLDEPSRRITLRLSAKSSRNGKR
ncbi:hypothetical protein Leryth_005171 [Lithospermum erythrorhizon]|nr:hypothetical protein Leryth_005171 [Lithospermum erythrorhizon]